MLPSASSLLNLGPPHAGHREEPDLDDGDHRRGAVDRHPPLCGPQREAWERAFDGHAARVREILGRRLTETGGEVLDAYRVSVELIESSSRLHRLARRLAQAMVEVRKPGPATRAGTVSPGRRETDIGPRAGPGA